MQSSRKSHEELLSTKELLREPRFWAALVFQMPLVIEASKERPELAREMFELLEGMLAIYMESEVIEDLREMCNLEKSRDEPSQPTRTPTTTGGKHVAGAKSAGSGETTPQAPVRPETQPATLPEAGGKGEETLAFSRNQPVFDSMRTEEEKNFALLPVYSHQMERSNPTLFLTKQQQLKELQTEIETKQQAKMEKEVERIQTKLKELQTQIEQKQEVIDTMDRRILATKQQAKMGEVARKQTKLKKLQTQIEQKQEVIGTMDRRILARKQLIEHQMREERRKNRSVKLEATVAHEKMREEEEGQLSQWQTYLEGITSSESGGLIQSLPGFVWEVSISLVGGLLFFGLRAAFGRIKF